jgi:hypothetical protein
MTEATSSGFHERQRLAVLETALEAITRPPSGEQLSWFHAQTEQPRDIRRQRLW